MPILEAKVASHASASRRAHSVPQISGIGYMKCTQEAIVPYLSPSRIAVLLSFFLRIRQENPKIEAPAPYPLTKLQTEISATLIQDSSLPHNKTRIPASMFLDSTLG